MHLENIKKNINIFKKNPLRIFVGLIDNKHFAWVSDELFIKIVYYLRTKKVLNLNPPTTFNEKLQWLKLYNYKDEYSTLVDKYSVRKYVKKTIGGQYLIPLYGVFDSFEEIDFQKLPKKFVLKTTHDSGGISICFNKEGFDYELSRKKLSRRLKKNYYYKGRERVYKELKPRIICEQLLVDNSGKPPMDYKIFCFHGEPKLIQIDIDRFGEHKQNFYDTKWNFQDIEIWCDNDCSIDVPKPENLDEMLNISKKLSKELPHVRVDLYNNNGNISFGELTFFHLSGMVRFRDEALDIEMGNWLDLSHINTN